MLLIRIHLNDQFRAEQCNGVGDSALICVAEAHLVTAQKVDPRVVSYPFRHYQAGSIGRIVIDHKHVQFVRWNLFRFLEDTGHQLAKISCLVICRHYDAGAFVHRFYYQQTS